MRISLITSTYNSAETLQATFDSVRAQKHTDLEYIVVDGASKDHTVDMIKANEGLISQWVSEPDKGIYDALNKGIAMATGDVVGFIHSDDILADEHALSHISEAFEANDIDAVYADLQYVDRSDVGKVIRHWKSRAYEKGLFRKGWMPAHPTFYLKTAAYREHGVYDTGFRISADYELMLRMLVKHQLRACYIPQVLVKMRVGGESNVSLKNRWVANQEDAMAWKKNGLKPALFTRWLKPISKISQYW